MTRHRRLTTICAIILLINIDDILVSSKKCNIEPEDATFLKCGNTTLQELNNTENKDNYNKLLLQTTSRKIGRDSINFRQLQHLKIQGTEFEDVTSDGLATLLRLRTLEISYSSYEVLRRRALTNLRKLQSLTISYTKLYKIELGAFDSLADLTHLDLSHNQVKLIEAHFLDSMRRLKTLNFFDNKIDTIPYRFFDRMNSLEYVNFGENQFKSIPENIFFTYELISYNGSPTYFSNLKEVIFSQNSITRLKDTNLAYLRYAQILSFRQCNLNFIGWEAFYNTPNLVDLDLSENNLDDEAFNRLEFRGLKKFSTLKLSSNKIRIFNSLKLNKCPITKLELHDNEITEIPPESFNYTTKLRSLTLYNNKITKLETTAFHNLKNLRNLDLSYNKINTIEPTTFSFLSNLINLTLSGNNLTELLPGTFDVFYPDDSDITSRILTLTLDWNQLVTITKAVFKPLRNVKILILSYNRIKQLPEDVFDTMTQLERLNLEGNQLRTLTGRLFEPLAISLTKLNLNKNQLSDIPGRVFKPLDRLAELELMKNSMQSVDEDLFNHPSLRKISLNNNEIKFIPKDALHGEDCYLETLNLFGNRLTFIDPEFFDNTHLKVFKYGKNPWICQCLDDMLVALKKNGISSALEMPYESGQLPSCVIGPNRTLCIKDVSLNDDIFKQYNYVIEQYSTSCTTSCIF